ncbi:DNA polymerase III subunit epsilon [Alishewanella sp. 16-MA]|uniref:DNA polymerase III subunit epsilon n=1 Tax=Alishewanella maricola TaxID=2795740 RepID=A0ABS8C0P3_9ALTE|nr:MULTISPECIES: exonuclease domain-containing protein [Gammaproteobacteria]MDP4945384.1 exonuclease domain-containing protein [Alishewanella sp.]MDP5207875.1 exonuclease domain-containing protein [Alishewanella sp. SMS9]MCB5225899.1 DNA polymerase III subunit epsilon [Alishewanella maricola]MCC5453032.1 DNA polymerase III subunit epsilon [Rheinheimera sp. UJ51]MDP5035780.1 exonuclease domain-containing protein [Alishewanella sp.]
MFGWLQKNPELYAEILTFNQVALPSADTPARECRYLVLDLELTGLNAKQDHIVSIGWLPIVEQHIRLSEARHYLIEAPVSVGQSAIYHGLHDSDLKDAQELADVLTFLLKQYPGYIFVAHHCRLDRAFLQIAFQRHFGKAPRMLFLDTLNIEYHRLQKLGSRLATDALRLPQCLARHHLPVSAQHHALEDAYGCALLFLSQLKKSHSAITLGDLQLHSR